MDVVRDLQALLAAPLDRAVVAPRSVLWCAAPDLAGARHVGALDEREARALVDALACVRHPAMALRTCLLWDVSAVERASGEAILALVDALRDALPAVSPRIARHAIVVGDGFAGVLLAGAVPSLAPTHPVRIFREHAAAWAYLAHPLAAVAHRVANDLADATCGPSPLIARLRAQLARQLDGATLGECARALGVSTRTLQRELLRCRTTFSDELRGLRIATAEELLELGDLKIEAIASRVGYRTASRLSATLVRERRATASTLRAAGHLRLARAR